MSIIPLLRDAPMKIPTAATARTTLKGAAFAPIAEFRKFTASLLTPATRSKQARISKNTRMQIKMISITGTNMF